MVTFALRELLLDLETTDNWGRVTFAIYGQPLPQKFTVLDKDGKKLCVKWHDRSQVISDHGHQNHVTCSIPYIEVSKRLFVALDKLAWTVNDETFVG